jgi:diguanylate cyclase
MMRLSNNNKAVVVVAITFEQARKSLDFLELQQLEPTPVNYDLALTYVTRSLPELSREIDTQTDGGVRLSRNEADTLIKRFLSKGKALLGAREKVIAQQTEQLGALTSEAHQVTSDLERDVANAVSQAGEWPTATSEFVMRLSDAERELTELRNNLAELQARVDRKELDSSNNSRDLLTRSLDRDGSQDLLRRLTTDGRSYVIIMFGLDNIEELNNKYGRSVGDNIINALAATLREHFQEQELVRWSGNQFVTILKDTAIMQARVIAEEALLAMSQRRLRLRDSGEWVGVVTASAGIVVGQHELTTDVLERARANLLSASEAGGNQIKG